MAEIRNAGEQVNVFFFDEARFGLQPCVGRVLCRRGVKPVCEIIPGADHFFLGHETRLGELTLAFLNEHSGGK